MKNIPSINLADFLSGDPTKKQKIITYIALLK